MDTNIIYGWKFFGGISHIFYSVSRFVVPWLKMAEKTMEALMQLVKLLGAARFQIFTQKWLLGNIKYLVRFYMKSLKSNGFRQTNTLSKHWPPTNKLLVV